MKKIFLTFVVIFLFNGCEDGSSVISPDSSIESSSWVFVANEGTYGASNGSISMIDEFGNVYETNTIGNVVQSLEVYENKLVVLINDPSKIMIYDITTEGLAMPGIEVSTDNSGPREMVIIDNMVYFTNWTTSDVKVFNLYTYNIDYSIPVGSLPEGIVTNGTTLWVANSGSDTVSKIDILSKAVTENYLVGQGPRNLVINNDKIYLSRTYYNNDWTIAYHGASKIEGIDVQINDYGTGMACGGSVLIHNSDTFRSFNGGLARMDQDLNLEEVLIGNFNQNQVYHVEKIDDYFWFAVTDYSNLNEIHVIDVNGNTLDIYQVGQIPGDFTKWNPSINR